MKYKYQMHIHTTPSACGRLTPTDLVEALYEAGYQGTVITNHFYHGNTGVDRSQSWHDFVAAYENDYIECKKEAEKYGLDIIFGVEESVVPGLEVLCYGITPSVLYENPVLQNCDIQTFYDIMHKNGVVIIQAHPFREAFYIPNPGPLPVEFLDGVEVYNKGNATNEMNEKAMEFAIKHNFIKTSSADAHTADRVPYGGIITSKRIKSSTDLAEILRSGDFELIIPNEE